MNNQKASNSSLHLRRLCAISLFCALAYICVFLIRFKVSFLTFDLKDSVMAIGAMYFGPISAVLMPAIVSLIEFLTIGSDTGVYGLIMNFISSASFCLVSSVIYKFRKNISGAVIALTSAAIVMTGVMMAANLFVTPYYMGVTMADVRGMIPALLFPFNLIKGVVNASVVMLLYKHFSKALKASGIISLTQSSSTGHSLSKKSKIIIEVVSAVVLAVSLLVLFLALKATIV